MVRKFLLCICVYGVPSLYIDSTIKVHKVYTLRESGLDKLQTHVNHCGCKVHQRFTRFTAVVDERVIMRNST